MDRELVKISKFLSLVLRHQPEAIGLTLDGNGWALVSELLDKAARRGRAISPELLQRLVAENDKKRFAFSEDGLRIRASQGHSVEVELGLEPVEPPETLYHGTARHSVASIRVSGLEPRSRQHVHLSADAETAIRVGQRHGQPVVLIIQAREMHQAGHRFYLSANGVWLTDTVPVAYLTFPE